MPAQHASYFRLTCGGRLIPPLNAIRIIWKSHNCYQVTRCARSCMASSGLRCHAALEFIGVLPDFIVTETAQCLLNGRLHGHRGLTMPPLS
eukprot:363580-Chlamydomonas_euryale.AAC.1